jgi:DNA-directed RNA polymerase subunit M/transcription elongation factor TFIIS
MVNIGLKVRRKCILMLREVISKYKKDFEELKEVSYQIESGIYDYSKKSYYSGIPFDKIKVCWEDREYKIKYINRARSIIENLDIDNRINNTYLCKKLIDFEIEPYSLGFSLSARDMFPEKYDSFNNKDNLIEGMKRLDIKDIPDGILRCGKCKKYKTTYYQMQTKAGDESMSTYAQCLNCGNRWVFS